MNMSAVSKLLVAGVLSLGGSALASNEVCKTYAKAPESALKIVKELEENTLVLGPQEKGMIQTAVQVTTPTQTHAVRASLDEFKETGLLRFEEFSVGATKHTVARVTYLPGDNEYGALFSYDKNPAGNLYISLLGVIRDGFVLCLE